MTIMTRMRRRENEVGEMWGVVMLDFDQHFSRKKTEDLETRKIKNNLEIH